MAGISEVRFKAFHKDMRQITDDMVKIIILGGGVHFEGFHLTIIGGWLKGIRQGNKLRAVSEDGQKNFSRYVTRVSQAQVKLAIERILEDINSRTHLPESAYKNGIRLNTEYRCQNKKCNPSGKRRLLFMSAGLIDQAIQIKCYGCGLLNTFWNNRIDFDESGALYMKKNGIGK